MSRDEMVAVKASSMNYGAVVFSLALIVFSLMSYVAVEGAQKSTAEKNKPIEITSNRLDAYSDKRLVVFSGNAKARQGDYTIQSDRIMLYYRGELQQPDTLSRGGVPGSEGIDRIEAKGNVTITQGERMVKGDSAVFFQNSRTIVVSGNAVMHEGRNVIHGNKIVVFLDENRGVVEGGRNEKVKATIYPEEKKEK